MSRLRTDSGLRVSQIVTGVLKVECPSCNVLGGHHDVVPTPRCNEGVGVTGDL